MNDKLDFLNGLMNANGISQADILDCYSKNDARLLDSKNIFDCRTQEDCSLAATAVELLYPAKAKYRYVQHYLFQGSTEWQKDMDNKKKRRKIFIITAMLYSTPFYIYASNWCYFMRLATDLYYSEHKNKKFFVLDQPTEGYGSKIFGIGEPMVIEGAGVLTVTGRYDKKDDHTIIKKTTFNFGFDAKALEGKGIKVTIEYDDNINAPETIVIDSMTLQDGKKKVHKTIDGLDFENGFEVSVLAPKNH